MDKEEEDTEEDKNNIIGREKCEGNDHKKEYWYCFQEILTKTLSTRSDTVT